MIKGNITIESEKLDIPKNIWATNKLHSLYTSELFYFDKINNPNIVKLYNDIVINISSGFLINFNDTPHIITCHHGTQYCNINKAFINGKYYDLKKIYEIPEFDVSILKIYNFIDIMDKYHIIDITDIDTKLPSIEQKILIHSKDNIIETIVSDINETYIHNGLFTMIPQICLKYIGCSSDNIKHGISGSPCYNMDNKFVGHVFSYDNTNNTINIIPAYCISYIFNHMIPTSNFNLKTIIINGSKCNITTNDNTKLIACKIKTADIINYKSYDINTHTINNDINYNLEQNLLVYEFDGLIFNNNCKIYFDKLGIYVSPEVYCLLNNQKEWFNIKGYKQINGIYETFNIDIIPVYLIDNLIFSNPNYNKVLIYKNFVFVELNIDIIDEYLDKDIKLKSKIINPYTRQYMKQIILIDIINKYEMIKNKSKNINNLIKNIESGILIFLKMVNNEIVYSIDDLFNKLYYNDSNSEFVFEIKNSRNKNIIY